MLQKNFILSYNERLLLFIKIFMKKKWQQLLEQPYNTDYIYIDINSYLLNSDG